MAGASSDGNGYAARSCIVLPSIAVVSAPVLFEAPPYLSETLLVRRAVSLFATGTGARKTGTRRTLA